VPFGKFNGDGTFDAVGGVVDPIDCLVEEVGVGVDWSLMAAVLVPIVLGLLLRRLDAPVNGVKEGTDDVTDVDK